MLLLLLTPWELRLFVGAQTEVVQTHVCRSQDEGLTTGDWKRALTEKGWTSREPTVVTEFPTEACHCLHVHCVLRKPISSQPLALGAVGGDRHPIQ